MSKSPDAFRTISEVAEWLGIPAHVLRFWESKFTQIKPVKRAGGRRYYRPADMLLIGGIKRLLHEDGLSIKEVQAILRDKGVAHVSDLSQALDDAVEETPDPALPLDGVAEDQAFDDDSDFEVFPNTGAQSEPEKFSSGDAAPAATDTEDLAAASESADDDDAPAWHDTPDGLPDGMEVPTAETAEAVIAAADTPPATPEELAEAEQAVAVAEQAEPAPSRPSAPEQMFMDLDGPAAAPQDDPLPEAAGDPAPEMMAEPSDDDTDHSADNGAEDTPTDFAEDALLVPEETVGAAFKSDPDLAPEPLADPDTTDIAPVLDAPQDEVIPAEPELQAADPVAADLGDAMAEDLAATDGTLANAAPAEPADLMAPDTAEADTDAAAPEAEIDMIASMPEPDLATTEADAVSAADGISAALNEAPDKSAEPPAAALAEPAEAPAAEPTASLGAVPLDAVDTGVSPAPEPAEQQDILTDTVAATDTPSDLAADDTAEPTGKIPVVDAPDVADGDFVVMHPGVLGRLSQVSTLPAGNSAALADCLADLRALLRP